jgi:hypothetical protein
LLGKGYQYTKKQIWISKQYEYVKKIQIKWYFNYILYLLKYKIFYCNKKKHNEKIKEKAHNSLSALTILVEDISWTPTQYSHNYLYILIYKVKIKLVWSWNFYYEKKDQIFICSNKVDITKNQQSRLVSMLLQ